MPISIGNPYGASRLTMSLLDSAGFWTGQVAGAVDTTSHAYSTPHITGSTFNFADGTTIRFRSADVYAGQATFGGGEADPFDIETDAVESGLVALFRAASVDAATSSQWRVAGTNSNNADPPQMGVMIAQAIQSREDATKGLKRYINFIFPVCTVSAKVNGAEFRGVGGSVYSVTPTFGSKFPWGESFGGDQDWTNNEADFYWIITQKPLAYTFFTGAGAGSPTFTTQYLPSDSVVTINAARHVYAEGGTPEALTSLVTTTGVATPDAAPASGVKASLMYETSFVAV